MDTEIDSNFKLDEELAIQQQIAPITASDVADLLDSKIVIAGANISDVAFMETMLKISGFSDITGVHDGEGVLANLRQGIRDDICDVDLIVLDNNLSDMTAHDLRLIMDQFSEWRLIPIIALTKESQWDAAQLLTDLGHGVTSLHYRPLTAESFPPAVTTALAVKKERDLVSQRQMQLEDELATLKVMEARLQFSVTHDDLTGLSNRRRLEQALELSLTQTLNFNTSSALFYIDLDSFKVLNDAEGHEAGDTLLVQVADSLRSYFSTDDTLVRIGSDEYAVLVDNIDEHSAMDHAEGLRSLFDGYHFEFNEHYYHLSVSIGVKIIEGKNESSSGEVLSQANQACFTAKKRGRNRVHLFSLDDKEMHVLRHSVKWAPRIRAALKQENFLLELQPIYALASNSITHYECLIRMRGSDDTLYYPDDFIPVAEAMGLIHQIDLWVVNKAFDLMSQMPSDISISINLSGNIFLDRNLFPLVEKKLAQTGIEPNRIVFEITETSAISNFEQTKEMVERLRSLGCRFALDDFGAGFNSYSYLKHFPVDILKIDGGFITNLINDPVDQLLVKSMIDIAHSLGKTTVAEFVENQSTMDLLKSYGVDFVQGYLIGKPQVYLPNP
ncbi:GGDEF-domain containing protein [Methylophaga sp. 42_25_T18]|nr:GGDEF-domain containing protein [Methylophaga sp. 42_25_T18]OUR85832.1 GGDEF-domain containing protein [Methylophaga sp. 42_8_T64]